MYIKTALYTLDQQKIMIWICLEISKEINMFKIK